MPNKIFLISSSISGVPVILELMENLQNNGIETFNIDILSGRKRYASGKVDDIYSNFILKILYKIPRLRVYVRRFCSRIYIDKNITKNDIVVLQFLDPNYLKFIRQLKKRTDNIIAHWWGSDLYRSDNKAKKKLSTINKYVEKHILVHGMSEYFLKYFPSEAKKISYAIFGVKLLDVMKTLQDDFDKEKQKSFFSIPKDKFVVTGGYNGSPGQQHIKIIESLNHLSEDIKTKIFLILPMTYGGSEEYLNNIENHLLKTKIDYKIIKDYLPENDLATLRLLSDITINIQITDGFSASIRESLFASNILIVGDWLHYEEIKKWGAFFIETSLDELNITIANTILNIEKIKQKTLNNSEIIYKNSSWDSCIKDIIQAYTSNKMI